MRASKTCIYLSVLLALDSLAATSTLPQYVLNAVADSSRAATDVQRDELRKPVDVLTFSGVKPGDKIVEIIPGRGYYTQLLCRVAGTQGHVYSVVINRTIPMSHPPANDSMGGMAAGDMPSTASACTNISATTSDAAQLKIAGELDLVWTSENYHDLHNKAFGSPDMKKFNQAIFDALKPGGFYLIEDHAAELGSGVRDTETLHRIDIEQVKQEVISAGFVLDASSDVLSNKQDTHTARVFDLSGKSDKFLLRFRKPKP